MGRLKNFVAISLIFHGIVLLALVDVGLTGRKSDTSDVYSVSIVAGMPSGASSAGSQGKKFVYNKAQNNSAFAAVKKERGLKEAAPEIAARNMKPEEPVDNGPDLPSSATGSKGQTAKGPAQGGSIASGLTPWKFRVKIMVDSLWQAPPEIAVMDKDLKVIYDLTVSRSGELLSKKLYSGSGNALFDRSILVALNKIKRLPPPPPDVEPGQDTVQITMGFSPPKGAY